MIDIGTKVKQKQMAFERGAAPKVGVVVGESQGKASPYWKTPRFLTILWEGEVVPKGNYLEMGLEVLP